jgi:hypothetical protein
VCFEVVGWKHALKAVPPPANPAAGVAMGCRVIRAQPVDFRSVSSVVFHRKRVYRVAHEWLHGING